MQSTNIISIPKYRLIGLVSFISFKLKFNIDAFFSIVIFHQQNSVTINKSAYLNTQLHLIQPSKCGYALHSLNGLWHAVVILHSPTRRLSCLSKMLDASLFPDMFATSKAVCRALFMTSLSAPLTNSVCRQLNYNRSFNIEDNSYWLHRESE